MSINQYHVINIMYDYTNEENIYIYIYIYILFTWKIKRFILFIFYIYIYKLYNAIRDR